MAVAVPAEVEPGDFVVIVLATDSGGIDSVVGDRSGAWSVVSDPDGDASTTNNGNQPTYRVAYGRMGSTVDTTLTVTGSASASGGTPQIAYALQSWAGVHETEPFDGEPVLSVNSGGGTPVSGALTTAVDGSVLMVLTALDDDRVTSFEPPDGFSNTVISATDHAKFNASVVITSKPVDAGTHGPFTLTDLPNDRYHVATFALAPAQTTTLTPTSATFAARSFSWKAPYPTPVGTVSAGLAPAASDPVFTSQPFAFDEARAVVGTVSE